MELNFCTPVFSRVLVSFNLGDSPQIRQSFSPYGTIYEPSHDYITQTCMGNFCLYIHMHEGGRLRLNPNPRASAVQVPFLLTKAWLLLKRKFAFAIVKERAFVLEACLENISPRSATLHWSTSMKSLLGMKAVLWSASLNATDNVWGM